jgi:hypothetical protein
MVGNRVKWYTAIQERERERAMIVHVRAGFAGGTELIYD